MESINVGNLRRLQEEYSKGLQRCVQRITQWTKFREDYVNLQKKLIALPDKVNYDVNVPFGSLAFMPGKMVHTNEILVLLGDDWFVERSSKQAAEIVARRILDCDANLLNMKRERIQYENWLESTAELQKDVVGGREIIEEYDEEKERLWKEQHRLNVKKQKQLQRSSKDVCSAVENTDEDDVWAKLSELEEAELDNDEVPKLSDQLPSDADEGGDDNDDEEEEEEEDDYDSDLSESFDDEAAVTVDFVSKLNDEKPKKVRWKELDSIGQPTTTERSSTLKASFTEPEPRSITSVDMDLEQTEERCVPCITSPADIYKQFGVPETKSQVKSILKPSNDAPSVERETICSPGFVQDSGVATSSTDRMDSNTWRENRAVSSTIVERDDTSPVIMSSPSTSEIQTPRRVSKFKAQRNVH